MKRFFSIETVEAAIVRSVDVNQKRMTISFSDGDSIKVSRDHFKGMIPYPGHVIVRDADGRLTCRVAGEFFSRFVEKQEAA